MALSKLRELPGAADDCTQLSLGGRGMRQLEGLLEPLAGLQVLWLHDNQLTCLDGLDSNTRLQQLYVHNNALASLEGSLCRLKFLTHLDASHNTLAGLDGVLKQLQGQPCLQELNLEGNLCCDEPHYRLRVIHALPRLQLLDNHLVTAAERCQAATRIGGDTRAARAAFGRQLPAVAATAMAAQQRATPTGSSGNLSVLQQELFQRAAAIRARQRREAAAAEEALFVASTDAQQSGAARALPLPPGVLAVQQAWAATHPGASCSIWGSTAAGVLCGKPAAGSLLHDAGAAGAAAHAADTAKAAAVSATPRDVLVLHSVTKRTSADDSSDDGCHARYLQGTHHHHLAPRSWAVACSELRL